MYGQAAPISSISWRLDSNGTFIQRDLRQDFTEINLRNGRDPGRHVRLSAIDATKAPPAIRISISVAVKHSRAAGQVRVVRLLISAGRVYNLVQRR